MALDPERLARFDREARALAALNHPNIAQIYGVETADGVPAMVMELVPGETLGVLMKSGPMPVERVLDYAEQMAAGLDAAHEKGIIHRDFKPGNVMVTPEGVIKVLDFGLVGRASNTTDAGYDPENSPTLTMAATQAGVIMGTAAYMAPEQASGKPVDKRADIWAFGVVLWEMLSGKRLFEGETISHVMAAVLTKEPDLSQIAERVRPLLRRCLEKDPRKRLRDVGDAMGLVGEAGIDQPGGWSAGQVSRPPRWAWVAAGVAITGLAAAGYLYFRPTSYRHQHSAS
jgi:serine/threonine protein kinase